MKKKEREDIVKEQEEKLKSFAGEYLTPKNILASVGIASLAGLATYSTIRAFKNDQLINRIKRELNFDTIKNNISSRFNEMGIGTKNNGSGNKNPEERAPVKRTQKSSSSKSKPKAKKRNVTR